MSHNLTAPVQDEVRIYWEFGEKRIVDKGRSSPNCEPRLLNVWYQLELCWRWLSLEDGEE